MKGQNILVLNMGMKSIRSIIFHPDGEKLAYAARPLETQLDADIVVQSPDEWWEKARMVIRESLVDVGKENIGYLTVTTSSSCLVYVDEKGQALDGCLMVSDKRGLSMQPRLREVLGEKASSCPMLLLLSVCLCSVTSSRSPA